MRTKKIRLRKSWLHWVAGLMMVASSVSGIHPAPGHKEGPPSGEAKPTGNAPGRQDGTGAGEIKPGGHAPSGQTNPACDPGAISPVTNCVPVANP